MSDRKITTAIVESVNIYRRGQEIENGWEDETGISMEPVGYDGQTAVDRAVAFLKSKYADETLDAPWQPGHYYIQQYTGVPRRRVFRLVNFTPEEEAAIFRGIFPKRAAQEARRAAAREAQQWKHRRLAVTRPHGLCEYVNYCLEHRQDRRVPSCKPRPMKNLRVKGRKAP